MPRNEKYYLEWDFVVLKVEDQLFRVPRNHLIKHSQFFADMFKLPQAKSSTGHVEGSDDAHPIVIPDGITAVEFEHFLQALLPLEIPWDEPDYDAAVWISVLKLSTMWMCLNMRAMAIRQINKAMDKSPRPQSLQPVECILLGRKHFVPDWVHQGYLSLITGPNSISEADAIRIGPLQAFKLVSIKITRTKMSASLEYEVITKFEAELTELRKQEALYTVSKPIKTKSNVKKRKLAEEEYEEEADISYRSRRMFL